jgi:hypothetical protein
VERVKRCNDRGRGQAHSYEFLETDYKTKKAELENYKTSQMTQKSPLKLDETCTDSETT